MESWRLHTQRRHSKKQFIRVILGGVNGVLEQFIRGKPVRFGYKVTIIY